MTPLRRANLALIVDRCGQQIARLDKNGLVSNNRVLGLLSVTCCLLPLAPRFIARSHGHKNAWSPPSRASQLRSAETQREHTHRPSATLNNSSLVPNRRFAPDNLGKIAFLLPEETAVWLLRKPALAHRRATESVVSNGRQCHPRSLIRPAIHGFRDYESRARTGQIIRAKAIANPSGRTPNASSKSPFCRFQRRFNWAIPLMQDAMSLLARRSQPRFSVAPRPLMTAS